MFHRTGREGLYIFVVTLALCLIGTAYFGHASNISNGCTTGPPVITRLANTCVGDQNSVLSGSVSCTWSANPPAGSSLLCGGATYGGGANPTGLSISDGTTFTNALAPRQNGATNRWSVVSYRFNIGVTAPATITMTITGGTDQFANLVCNAFTDTGTPTADGTCTFDGSTSATTQSCTSSITTTGLDYVTGFIGASGTFPTAGAGWTIGANVKGTATETQIQTVAGSINPLFNVQSGQTATMTGFAVKP